MIHELHKTHEKRPKFSVFRIFSGQETLSDD